MKHLDEHRDAVIFSPLMLKLVFPCWVDLDVLQRIYDMLTTH